MWTQKWSLILPRVMDRTFDNGICEGYFTVYIKIFGQIRKIFFKSEKLNMSISLKKFPIKFSSLRVLVHIGSGVMIPFEQKRVKAVQVISPPRELKVVKGFIGICGHYRKKIKNVSTIVLPFSKKTWKIMYLSGKKLDKRPWKNSNKYLKKLHLLP